MSDPALLRFLAFYLPQYHPIPENDEWWGPGFTEWTNVAKARPQFRGHQQPHLPGELGFYDLRVPEVRAAQAELAASRGIDGFCYYHYWFGGKRLLERPFTEVLRSGEPDFPFLLCWANENWTRVWDGGASNVLIGQDHSDDDDREHLRTLAEAFADPRYVCIDGRPVFLVYRAGLLPEPERTAEVWKQEAVRLGLREPYLCSVEAFAKGEERDPRAIGFDAAVRFAPGPLFARPPAATPVDRLRRRAANASHRMVRRLRPAVPSPPHQRFDYDEMIDRALATRPPTYKRFPCVTPGFDNSARRPGGGAHIVTGSDPQAYERWLRAEIERFEPYSADENLFFVNAWNEWAEGNHLEPCARWGRGYLDAHARATGR